MQNTASAGEAMTRKGDGRRTARGRGRELQKKKAVRAYKYFRVLFGILKKPPPPPNDRPDRLTMWAS